MVASFQYLAVVTDLKNMEEGFVTCVLELTGCGKRLGDVQVPQVVLNPSTGCWLDLQQLVYRALCPCFDFFDNASCVCLFDGHDGLELTSPDCKANFGAWFSWVETVHKSQDKVLAVSTYTNLSVAKHCLAYSYTRWSNLQHFPCAINNKEVVLVAVARHGSQLNLASAELQQDVDVVAVAVQTCPELLSKAPKCLQENSSLILLAVASADESAHVLIPPSKSNDKEFALKVMQANGRFLSQFRDSIRQDREIVLAAVRQNGVALCHASKDLQADKLLVIEAVQSNAQACMYISKTLMEDPDIRALVYSKGYALYHNWPCVQANKYKVLDQVSKLPSSLVWAGWYGFDTNVVHAAVTRCGLSLHQLSCDLRDKATVLLAVKQNGRALAAAPACMRSHEDVVDEAILQTAAAFEFTAFGLRTKARALFAAQHHGDALKYLPRSLHTKKVIFAAVQTSTKAIEDVKFQSLPSEDSESKLAQHYVACCQAQSIDAKQVDAEASCVCTKRLCVMMLSLFYWSKHCSTANAIIELGQANTACSS